MRIDCRGLSLLALIQLVVLAGPLFAQTPAPSAGKADRETESASGRVQPAVERVEPDILYTRDKNGDLIPLLSHSVEEIRELLQRQEGAVAAPRTSFRIERLAAAAEVVGDYARLSIDLTIVASDEGWIRVPLRLNNLALTHLPEFADEGQHFVDFDSGIREYLAWFRGKAGESHRLSLRGLLKLDRDGNQSRLRLNAPRAVFSELQLVVPEANAIGQVLSGGALAETTPLDGQTQFRVTGLTNDFSLAWRRGTSRPSQFPTVLAAEGEIVSHIDGRGVDTTATLRVNAFGREFNGFQVRLPRGATLMAAEQPDYSVTQAVPSPGTSKDERQQPLVDVRLKAKTSTPVTVEIKTKQGHDMTREGAIELGGFDVAGAVRQSGIVAIHASDDWQVALIAKQGVLQTDDLPADMHGDAVVAGFSYFGQPFSLSARVSPRQTRTSVEPSYVIQVGPHHLQLEGSLKYHIAGAKVFSFSIDLGEWQLDPASLERSALVNSSALVFAAGNSVLIPLKQASTGEIELKIRARKPIAPDAQTIAFTLPRLTADTVGSTELAVIADDNVVLTPRPDEMSGLSPAGLSSSIKLEPRRKAPLLYRSDLADPQFTAGIRTATRRITTRVVSEVTIGDGVAKVAEQITCNVEHEPAEWLRLDMPQALSQAGAVVVEWQGKRLPLEPIASDESHEDDRLPMQISFPEALLGDIDLTVSYIWPDEAFAHPPSGAATVRAEVPLVMPGEGELVEARLTLFGEPRLQIEPIDKDWLVAESPPRETDKPKWVLSTSHSSASIVLGISPRASETEESLVVQRVWIQTWLTDGPRFDRAVFQFRTRERQVRLKLPPGRVAEHFLIDGQANVSAVQGDLLDERILTLPEGTLPDATHVLEVTYHLENRPGDAGQMSLKLPELDASAADGQSYWQLVLPGTEYLLSGPPPLANDFAWVWSGMGWSHQPLLDTGELEVWSRAHEQEGPLPRSVNVYLFSGRRLPSSAEIVTVTRPMVVLVASGLLLAVGLLWIYFPRLRQPSALFVAGVMVLATAAIWPDLSLLAAQGAVVGAILVALAAALERRLAPRPIPPVLRGSSSSIVGRGSTHSHVRAGSPANLSTQTAALAVQMGADSKS